MCSSKFCLSPSLLRGFSLSKQPVSRRPPLPAPVAICCSCLKSSEATGEGWARYVQQTVEPGRSMSRIVSLYKSVSDNSPWPSACCWLLTHTHTLTLHTFMRQTHFSHTPRGLLRWSQRGRTHQWRIQIVFDSHYRWLFTH